MIGNKGNNTKKIIGKCLEQNKVFKEWDHARKYYSFHHSHYDWWAFPINQRSSHGDKYMVFEEHIEEFANNQQFIKALRSNSILVCRAWGYDLVKGKAEEELHPDQKWQNWPIRLYKMTRSLELFKQEDLHKNAVKYGFSLINKGHKFAYSSRDLSAYFLQQRNKIQPKI